MIGPRRDGQYMHHFLQPARDSRVIVRFDVGGEIAALAGAEDALVFSSGVAAISAAVMANAQAGDHAAARLYCFSECR